ncbi:MAG TPA: agmatinase family protein [Kiritimatiellia bacterium]|mgnify:CR=1 FL=1|nr:agmatinase family protein [Kiritimatiellia bacterium]
MSLQKKIQSFDPNQLGRENSGIFGLPFTPEEARVVVVPVPWEVTVSYGGGTLRGPHGILEASRQVDLYDPDLPDAWKLGVAMDPIPASLIRDSQKLRKLAVNCIEKLAQGRDPQNDKAMMKAYKDVNAGCTRMIKHVRDTTSRHLANNKMVALVGGDHSTPLGFIEALADKYKSFGILQMDAHADLREAYEGFRYSHASIMYNALKVRQVTRLVQAGIRDYCDEEVNVIRQSKGRVVTFFDRDIKRKLYAGQAMNSVHKEIVKKLPKLVYVSFDIDGLDPKLCPRTGTPVPGGFEFEEALQLVKAVVDSGRMIIGLDVNEVSPGPDEWDANVGARLLFRLINLMAASHSAIPR